MIFDLDALWEHQSALNDVPADPEAVVVPVASWLGPDSAPYGTVGASFVTNLAATTEWPLGEALWLRRALTVDGLAPVVLRGEVKNAAFIYLDGVLAGVVNPANVAQAVTEFQVVLPQSMLPAGVRELAVLLLDVLDSDTTWFWATAAYQPAMVPLWPGPGLQESIEWMTALEQFEDGGEERERLRGHPRHSFRMDCFVPGTVQRRIVNLLWGARDDQWLVPTWSQIQQLGAVTAGELTLDALTSYSEFHAGQLILLWESPTVWQVLGLDAVIDANTLGLTTPTLEFTDAHVMPVRRGFMTSDPSRAFDGRTSRLSVNFQIEENRALTVAAPAQYLGNDIYYEPGLLDGGKSDEQIEVRMDVLDEDLGLVHYSTPWSLNRPARSHRMLADGPEETWAMREWLHRRAGRLTPFWQPSFEADMRVTSTGALTTTLRVALDDWLRWSRERYHIAVETTAGAWLPRAITNAVQDGEEVILTLSSSLAINASLIDRVCFLGLRRLDSDRAELNWVGGFACAVAVPVLDIQP